MSSTESLYEYLVIDYDGAVATLTLNRPDAMNALNMGLKTELADAISKIADNPEVRCLVLTGAGKAFSAGGDISEMAMNDNPLRSRNRLQVLLRDVFVPLAEMEKPTIASVNGHALGAGLSLALACDLIFASEKATMSCAFSKMGLMPDCGSLYFLPRRLPMSVAKELIFTGRRFSAAEALEMRLVNSILPGVDLDKFVRELALELASGPTAAFGITKRLLDQSSQSSLSDMSVLEEFGQAVLFATEDHLAAREAFINKSTVVFNGL